MTCRKRYLVSKWPTLDVPKNPRGVPKSIQVLNPELLSQAEIEISHGYGTMGDESICGKLPTSLAGQ